jgi:hypothetical protein
MPGVENNTPLRLSLVGIKETGFSIRPDLREQDIEKIDWMIGFRPILQDESQIAVEVRSAAINTETNIEVASCAVMLTYTVDNIDVFVTKESDTKLNIRDHLMLNMLNPAYGTLRGVMYARFAGTLLEHRPLPLIDIQNLVRAAKRNEAAAQ